MLTPIKIENRMNGFLGTPAGSGKKPTVIHLHERYGIVQHTTDLGEKFVRQGYVTIVPDLFSRFTGDRDKLAKGDDRCDLDDAEVLKDIDAVVEHLRAIPEVDMSRIAISGAASCSGVATGRSRAARSAARSSALAERHRSIARARATTAT